jgi:two-component system, cell cycle response regulator DivK
MSLNWSNKTILVAEDEATNFLFVEKIIKPTQAQIIRAENGSDALSIVNKNKEIDLVLMDIYMPGMDGFEAAEKIREIRPDLPIIAQTFFESQIENEKIENASFDAFIRKPININKLLAILEKYLKTSEK